MTTITNFIRKCISAALLLCCCIGFATSSSAQTIYALSGNNLISFDAQTPATILSTGAISGISAGQALVGIDFRPNTGELFGLGYNSATGEARLYTIALNTGVATPVGATTFLLNPNMGLIGFDFNPTVDRIRVTGSNNANFRLNPITGGLAATDGVLAFAGTDTNTGADPMVGTVAYTNSFIGSTSTTLYNYDVALNVLTTQIPPNNGTLNTVGGSGLAVNATDASVDLDINFNSLTGVNEAFLVANTGTGVNDSLYRVNLATGATTLVGAVGNGLPVGNIAIQIIRNVPPTVTGDLLYALTAGNNLISFDSDEPEIIRSIVPVSGIAMGQVLSGLDFRPATGELFGLGYNTANGEARLYTLNLTTGVATAVGAAAITLAPGLGKIGFDFNPTVDRIRVTGSNNNNYRLNPITGALAFTDTPLAYAAGDANAASNPSIGAVAYTNSFNGTTTTTLYNYDDSLNIFTIQNPPNNGTLNTLGASGITLNLGDPSADFDIYYDFGTQTNRAYLSANTGTSTFDDLYTVDLPATGTAAVVGKIGLGIAVTDLTAFLRTQATLACTSDTTITAPAGVTSVVASYTIPQAASTCINGAGTPVLISGPASGTAFPLGASEVCYALTDSCGGIDTCCFTITVKADEPACDIKNLGCLRFEMLSVRRDAQGDEVFRIRVVNDCPSTLTYVAFELPKGIVADAPGSTYTAPSGRSYAVRNPNFGPFYSIRFKAQGTGIGGGQSDVFEYTLPQLVDVKYIHSFVRFADGTGREAYLNTFKCPIQNFTTFNGPGGVTLASSHEPQVYPNPSSGVLYVDASAWEGRSASMQVFNTLGQLIEQRAFIVGYEPMLLDFPQDVADGVFFITLQAADGERVTKRFVLKR